MKKEDFEALMRIGSQKPADSPRILGLNEDELKVVSKLLDPEIQVGQRIITIKLRSRMQDEEEYEIAKKLGSRIRTFLGNHP